MLRRMIKNAFCGAFPLCVCSCTVGLRELSNSDMVSPDAVGVTDGTFAGFPLEWLFVLFVGGFIAGYWYRGRLKANA